MAFYSVRVDDEGKEIETTRQTFRKLYLDSLESVTVRGSIQGNVQNESNNYKTVRYVNSATFIEKDLKAAKKAPLSEEEEEDEEDQDGTNSSDCSGYNTDDIIDQQYQTHIAQDCEAVPLLELNSNESFPSSNNMSYSYRKVCEVTKMIQKPDAYKEWLDAKKASKVYEQQLKEQKKKTEEEKKKERKMLAEKKFQEWLAKKSKTKVEQEKNIKPENETKEEIKALVEEKQISKEEQKAREKNFQAWLKKKMRQEKSQKEKLNEELKRERELEKKRREQAATIYKSWLKTAPQKPKPVPLNRGMLTLKGSVSEIYMNPIPWMSADDADSTTSL